MESNEKPNAGGKRGEMIVVCGAKGGIGKTVITVNLAVALSKNNIRISVLDGDFQFGDVCLAMDLHPTFTIKDVAESLDSMDEFALSGYLINHNSGVKVMAAPDRPEYADLIKPNMMEKVCDLLLAQHDYLLVDTGAGLQDHTIQLIEKADQVFVMTTMEMASVKNTKMMLETFEVLGVSHKVQVVLNRSTMESVIKPTDIPDLLVQDTPMFIPNDFQIVSQSLNTGIPFVQNQGKTDIAKSVFRIAEQMISRREIALFKPKPPSIMQMLFNRNKGNMMTP